MVDRRNTATFSQSQKILDPKLADLQENWACEGRIESEIGRCGLELLVFCLLFSRVSIASRTFGVAEHPLHRTLAHALSSSSIEFGSETNVQKLTPHGAAAHCGRFRRLRAR